MDGLSSMERSVRYALYWQHDGTRKKSAEAFAAMTTRNPVQEVVKALLDKFNEDNSCLGVCSLLTFLLTHFECHHIYSYPYELNFTILGSCM